jgi:hypothetical protein
LFVFLGVPGIVFGVFLGIAPGAECFVPNRGEYDSHHTPVVGGFPHGKDHLLDSLGGIGIILLGIVQDDPGVEQAFNWIAIKILAGTFFEQDFLVCNFGKVVT